MSKFQCPMNLQVPMTKTRRCLWSIGIWSLVIPWTLGCGKWTFAEEPRPTVLVVLGAEGTEEYGRQFHAWSKRWGEAAQKGRAEFGEIGLAESGDDSDRERLKKRLAELPKTGTEPLWLILIGHGTFDGKLARFNLRGPDFAAKELAEWLQPIERPIAVINCASSSGPFLNELSSQNRIVITATRSGHEYNFARFGDFLSAAINDPQADLDKDEQTSLLEAFLAASSRAQEFYSNDGRLVTEHALLDDNGDRLGTPADWFRGVRAVKSAKSGAAVDGLRAGQLQLVRSDNEVQLPAATRERRDQVEQELAQLRLQRAQHSDDEYLALIEPLLVELAKLYESAASSSKK